MSWYDDHALEQFHRCGLAGLASGGHPCACMGPQRGEPLCPCQMGAQAKNQVLQRLGIVHQIKTRAVILAAVERAIEGKT